MKIFDTTEQQYQSYRQTFLATPVGRAVLKDIIVNVPVAVRGDTLTVWSFLKEIVARTGALHPQNMETLLTKLSELPIPLEIDDHGEAQG